MTYIGASQTSTGADPAVTDFVAMAHALLKEIPIHMTRLPKTNVSFVCCIIRIDKYIIML